jgi:8-oxo-dGTP pyrophosphatase MutT (NUDIX family)
MTKIRSNSVPARPSATIVLLRDFGSGPELLMVRRRAGDAFGGSYAFPGGVLDADESSARAFCCGVTVDEADAMLQVTEGGLDFYSAAIRELFEETGMLLARSGGGDWATDSPRLQELRGKVDQATLAWPKFLEAQKLHMACDALHYFAHWETPLNRPKRWSTRFFIAEAPSGQDASHDGSELTGFRWASAAEALSSARSGDMKLPFPTIRTLKMLAEFNSADSVLDWARKRTRDGVDKIRPVELLEDGVARFVIPGDPYYPEGGDGEE